MKKRGVFHKTGLTALLWIQLFVFLSLSAQTADPDPERFRQEIDAFALWDSKNSAPDGAVLFVGSSSIALWKTAESFPGLKVINRGFGGSHISDVNFYYDRIVRKYRPYRIVFYAGDNDIAGGKTPEEVLEDFKEFAGRVRADMPETEIIYIPIKPSVSRWHLWPGMDRANQLIREIIRTERRLFCAETAGAMLNERAEPDAGLLLEDGLHLNEKGYELWTKILSRMLIPERQAEEHLE